MATNGQQDSDKLNQLIDEMLESDSGFTDALAGDNPLLYVGAVITNAPKEFPTVEQKKRILEKVNATEVLNPVQPNPFANFTWLLAVGLVLAALAFGIFNNLPADDAEATSEILQGDEIETTEEITLSAEPSVDSTAELTPETSEATETATESPESTVESESTESSDIAETEDANSLLTILFVSSGGPVNVRSEPSILSEIVTTVSPNTELIVIATSADNSWYQVTLPDGTQGWIASFLLSDTRGGTGSPINPGGSGRDAPQDCERGNSCNAPGHTGESSGNGNGRGQGQGGT